MSGLTKSKGYALKVEPNHNLINYLQIIHTSHPHELKG